MKIKEEIKSWVHFLKCFWDVLGYTDKDVCSECPVLGSQDCSESCPHFGAFE